MAHLKGNNKRCTNASEAWKIKVIFLGHVLPPLMYEFIVQKRLKKLLLSIINYCKSFNHSLFHAFKICDELSQTMHCCSKICARVLLFRMRIKVSLYIISTDKVVCFLLFDNQKIVDRPMHRYVVPLWLFLFVFIVLKVYYWIKRRPHIQHFFVEKFPFFCYCLFVANIIDLNPIKIRTWMIADENFEEFRARTHTHNYGY